MITQHTFNTTVQQINDEFKRLDDKIKQLEAKLDKKPTTVKKSVKST